MKNVWIISEEDHGVLGVAENSDDAIYWLHKSGWLDWDDPMAVSWWDEEYEVWRELSVREAAEKYGEPIEDFLDKVLVEGMEDCEMMFSFRCIPMIEPYNKLPE